MKTKIQALIEILDNTLFARAMEYGVFIRYKRRMEARKQFFIVAAKLGRK